MFRKLVIIAMIMGMAGLSLAVTIGLPTSANSWSTSQYVSATASTTAHSRAGAVHTIDGKGISTAGTLHGNLWSDRMWYGGVADSNVAAAKYASGITYAGPAWIVYNFKDEIHNVTRIQIWNYNECSNWPRVNMSKFGIKNCKIEYSTDGRNWTRYNSGTSVTLTQASGYGWDDPCAGSAYLNATKEPVNTTISTGGILARYIAIIPETGPNGNFATGPTDSESTYGLSEVRFIEDSNRATTPVPNEGVERVAKNTALTWVKGDGTDIVKHKVYLGTDKTAVTNRTVTGVLVTAGTSYDTTGLLNHSTMYHWAVDELNASNAVVTGGSGRVWNFSTPYCNEANEPRNTHGNLNSDCFINFKDFATICDNWRMSGYWPE